jgi:beta-glucanase (GH16 family)
MKFRAFSHHASTRRACQLLESLETRRLLSYTLPAYADQIGLTGSVNLNTTFEDTFDGHTLNSSKWQVREGPRWRSTPASPTNNWTHRDAVQVNNGVMTLTAYTDPATGQLRSGWVQTGDNFSGEKPPGQTDPKLVSGYTGDFEQKYGYWEARMKFSSLPGMWGAFWVHSYKMVQVMHDPATANRPDIYGTEYDVAEHGYTRGGVYANNDISSVTHANGYESLHRVTAVNTNTNTLAPSFSSPQDWHVYGLLWTPTSASFYIDGNLVYRETDPAMVSKVPHVGIFSTEIGAPGSIEQYRGNNYWGHVPANGYGTRDTSTAKTSVDYVRVWQLSNQSPPPATNTASVVGVVFNDANANGIKDASEAGLSHRTVYLDTNWNGVADASEPSANTNASGEYVISNLTAGSYVVRQVLGANTFQTAPGANTAVTLSAGERETLNFGVGGMNVTPPALTALVEGSVFNDTNANGVKDATEAGRAGVNVYLDLNYNGQRDANETQVATTSNGTFRFASAPATIGLAVRVNLAGTGLLQTTPTSNNPLWLTTVAGRAHAAGMFGVREPIIVPPVAGAILTGNVFTDANWNTKRDASEVGRGDVRVYVDYNFNNQRDAGEPTTLTAANGTYRFEGVRAGTVALRLDLSGTNLTQSSPGTGTSIWLSTQAGLTYADNHFGVAPPLVVESTSSLTGNVFGDVNWNGRQDTAETGRSSVSVYLDLNMNGTHESSEPLTNTDAYGSFRFDGVKSGVVAVRLKLVGTTITQTTPLGNGSLWVNATGGKTYGDLRFGISGTGSSGSVATNTAAGVVFFDYNADGTRGAGESGMGGLKVWIDYDLDGLRDANEPVAVTNASGAFSFTNIRSGVAAFRIDTTNAWYTQSFPLANGAWWKSFGTITSHTDLMFGVRSRW